MNFRNANFKFFIIVISVFLGNKENIVAQNDSLSLIEISVVAPRSSIFDVGNEKTNIQNIQNIGVNSLSEKLAMVSSIALKQYSLSGLQSFSIRGTAPKHNAVLWNGVNLQSSMNGIVDVSLLSMPIFDAISVVAGGQSALHGSGAIGGVLDLGSTKSNYTKAYQSTIYGGFGSFGERFGALKFELNRSRNSAQIRFFRLQSDNNFEYHFLGQPLKNINAKVQTQGALLSFAHRFGAQKQLSFDAWLQQSDRNIPPSAVENNVSANQKDAAIRMNLDYLQQIKKWTIKSKLFYSFETIDYQSLVTPLAHSFAQSSILEQEFRKQINQKNIFSLGAQFKNEAARGPNYKALYQRNTIALWTAFRSDVSAKSTFSGNVRLESFGKNEFPLTAQLGFNLKCRKNSFIKASLSKNYKTPTFNDLYWPQLGNPDLQSEKAYTGNVTYHFFKPLDVSITHFQNYVSNWIEWAPYQGSLFRPRNILAVWSRGIELNVKQKIEISSHQFIENQLSYSYVKTTYEKGVDINSLHKQLTYNPLHTISLANQYHFNSHFQFEMNHVFTSQRYVTSDNLSSLKALVLGNLSLQYSNKVKQKEYDIVIKSNNIWNTPYQSIQYRPMPERRYSLSLNLKI